MKNIYLFLLLLCNGSLFAGWTQQTTNNGFGLYSIYFVNANVGYTAGLNGTILKTTDAGATWTAQTTNTNANLYAIWFTDANTGYACGSTGILLETTNGGTTWTASTLVANGYLQSIYFTSHNTGYIAASAGAIYRTTDGVNWGYYGQTSVNVFQVGINYATAKTAFIAGQTGTNGGILQASSDSGSTWVPVLSNAQPFTDVFFPTAHTGYVVGQNGLIFKSVDGGVNWTSLNSGSIDENYAVFFIDSLTGYVATAQGVLNTTDGGATWNYQYLGEQLDVFFADACHGYMATYEGYVYATDVETAITGNLTGCDSIVLQADTTGCNNCTYHWSNGSNTFQATVTTSNQYTVTATNSCGSGTASYTVQVTHAPTAAITYTLTGNVYNFNGNVQGSTNSYSWNFGNGATSTSSDPAYAYTASGQYIVSLKVGNSCGTNTYYDTLNVTVACYYNLSQYSIITDSSGTTAEISITTGNNCPWSVQTSGCTWLTASPDTGRGDASIFITIPATNDTFVKQCMLMIDTQYVSVTQYGKRGTVTCPVVDTSVQINACNLAAATINGADYQWYLNGVALQNGNSQYFTATQAGYYHVGIGVGNCTYQSNDHYVSPCTGINNAVINNLAVYPNPSNGSFIISGDAVLTGGITINVYNTLGQLVYGKTIANQAHFSEAIAIADLAAGIYPVQVMVGGNSVYARLFIK